MKLDHIPSLKREIKNILSQPDKHKFPLTITFNEGMEYPEFEITIDKIEKDTYIDSSGQKWKKVR